MLGGEMTHVWEVVGSNPGAVTFSYWFVVKSVSFVWKDQK